MPDVKVEWPRVATSESVDLLKPVQDLMTETSLLGVTKVKEEKAKNFSPGSDKYKGLIESSVLQVTTQARTWIGVVGGTSAAVGLVGAWLAEDDGNTLLAIALIAAAALLGSAYLVSMAVVTNGDVRGRAAVTTEQVAARGRVLGAYLAALSPKGRAAVAAGGQEASPTVSSELFVAALGAFGTTLEVKKASDSDPRQVEGIRWTQDGGLLVRAEGDEMGLDEIAWLNGEALKKEN